MAGCQGQFYVFLNNIVSTDNNIRFQAEEAYNNIATETKVAYLVGAIQNAEVSEDGRQTAAVLLGQLFSADFFFSKLPFEQQKLLREQLLLTIQMDLTQPLRRKVCDVVSELAIRSHLNDDGANQWPEFLQFMFTCANAQDSNMKEAGIRMFTSVPGVLGNLQNQNLDAIKRMLFTALQPTESEALRVQAVKAFGSFILYNAKEPAIQKHLSDLLEPMMRVVVQSMEKAEDDSSLKVLIELADSAPKFLRPQLENIFQAAIKMVGDKYQKDNWRQLALKVMVTLYKTAPAMVRKKVPMAEYMLTPLVLEMMCEIDDNPEWAMEDEAANNDNKNNNVVAESALGRMCCGLGEKIMLDVMVGSVPVMLQSEDWRRRHAALMAVSSMSEGCRKQMKQMLDQVVSAVLYHLADPHPRVRYAACNAVGQMATDFAPLFEKKFHDKVVPGLLTLLDDNTNPRVQAHAAAALVNFNEDCPKRILTLYLDPLMNKLEVIIQFKFNELIEHGRKHVLEQIVTTIASIADTVKQDFVTYYDRVMTWLKNIIANATTAELKMLRGKTIECVSLIGLAVGANFFRDATEVIDLLIKTHTEGEQWHAGAPQITFLNLACRICFIMGKNFAEYLPMVMETVMRTAAMQPEVTRLDDDDIEDDRNWQFISPGELQNFGFETAGLKDKVYACNLLVWYARELKEAFAEYAEGVVKLMVPMLKFYFHDKVRMAAAESLPYLLKCARIRGHQYIEGMWAYILPELLKAINSEPVQEVQVKLIKSLAKCIKLLGTGCLTEETMPEVLRIAYWRTNKLLTEHFERADEDYDEKRTKMTRTRGCGSWLTCYAPCCPPNRESFFPHLDTLLPHLVAPMAPGRPLCDRIFAIAIFDDVIKFGGPACVKYQDIFLEPMLNGLCSPESEVREIAAHSCGVLAKFGGPQFADACARAVPQLAAIVAEPDAQSDEKFEATENAISALTKIIQYNHSKINREEIIRHWLTWLPVVKDTEEAPRVYSLLLLLLAKAFLKDAVPKDSVVFSQMVALVRQIQCWLCNLVMYGEQGQGSTGADLPSRELEALVALFAQTNAELWNSCLMQFYACSNEELQQALQQALSHVA